MTGRAAPGGTVDAGELDRFERLAARWWDEDGAFAPLHRMNPVRIGYVRDRLAARAGRAADRPRPLDGLDLLDVGCGGGLLAEPMARLGARVTAIDAGREAIAAARHHAALRRLSIDYRVATAEELAAGGAAFDAVLALEVVEHVADPDVFLGALATLLRPGGTLILSTLNRTAGSFALAILGAEYLLGWLPRGTHDWRRFLRPSELAAGVRRQGLAVEDVCGMVPAPAEGGWRLDRRRLGVNYLLAARRPQAA